MTITRLPAQRCECGKILDTHGGRSGTEPKPPTRGNESLSICNECGRLARFDADLRLVPVELDAMDDIDPMQKAEIKRIQAAIRARRKN